MLRRTGETSIARGIYHSTCRCHAQITVRPGDRFPDCPDCRRAVTWVFKRSVLVDAPTPTRPKETRS